MYFRHCSFLEQSVLKHLTQELESSGSDETTLMSLFETLSCNAAYDGNKYYCLYKFSFESLKYWVTRVILVIYSFCTYSWPQLDS